jgi:hypothetical protein
LGYDVELKEVKPTSKDTSTYSYFKLNEEKTKEAGGVPQFEESPTEISVSSTTGATAYAIKTITPNGSYGGGVGVNTTAPKTATSKKSGSSGSSSKKETKKRKKASDEIERYHEVDKRLAVSSNELAKLNNKIKKAFDKDLVGLMREEIELLNDSLEDENLKLEEVKDNLDKDKAAL